jgi:cobalt-zinc-cadmium efflux system outer membrane protein
MRKLLVLMLAVFAGCQACPVGPHLARDAQVAVEAQIASVVQVRVTSELQPCGAPVPRLAGPVDLPSLWQLALANTPSLREAAAEVEAARGQWLQAGLYPNPRLLYDQDTVGSRISRQGNFNIQLTQEIVTAGKLRLGQMVAARQTDVAYLALVGRKFETLTRVRRAFANYSGWLGQERASREVAAGLEKGLATTRELVEKAKTRPRSDLLRAEALLEEARISLARSRAQREAAWRELAAEVGVPDLPPPEEVCAPSDNVPPWDAGQVQGRVLAANTAVRQATLDADRAGLALQKARAQAIPNVTVGGGYNLDNTDQTAGGQLTLEMPIPVWDRNQGNIRAAKASLAQALAAVRSAQMRLSRETATAFGSYVAAQSQVRRLQQRVLPRLQESVDLLTRGYRAGSAQVTFADVLQAEQSLFAARVTLAEARRGLWLALADLQGLMQLDLGEDFCPVSPQTVGTGQAARTG